MKNAIQKPITHGSKMPNSYPGFMTTNKAEQVFQKNVV